MMMPVGGVRGGEWGKGKRSQPPNLPLCSTNDTVRIMADLAWWAGACCVGVWVVGVVFGGKKNGIQNFASPKNASRRFFLFHAGHLLRLFVHPHRHPHRHYL